MYYKMYVESLHSGTFIYLFITFGDMPGESNIDLTINWRIAKNIKINNKKTNAQKIQKHAK